MRYVVLLLGILGAAGSGYLGYTWWSDYQANKDLLEDVRKGSRGDAEMEAKVAELDRTISASYFLLAGLPLGIAGAILAVLGRTGNAAALMLVAAAGPAILNWRSLLFTFPLLVASVLCFLVKAKPSAEPG